MASFGIIFGYVAFCGWGKGALNVLNFTEATLRNLLSQGKMPHILPLDI